MFLEYRKDKKRFSDFIPWMALFDDQTVVCKEGLIFRTLLLEGPDLLSSDMTGISSVYSQLNRALYRLCDDRWAIWFEEKRCKSFKYLDELPVNLEARKIMDSREEYFRNVSRYTEYQFLTIAYQTKTDVEISREMVSEDQFDFFDSEYKEFLGVIEGFIETTSLRGEDLLGFLHSTVSKDFYSIKVPSWGFYLDCYLCDTSFRPGMRGEARLGNEYVSVVSINNFPPETMAGDLGALSSLDCEYRFVSRFLFMSKEEAEKKLKSYRNFHLGRRKNLFQSIADRSTGDDGPEDPDASMKASDVENALISLGGGNTGFGYYSSLIVLQDENLDFLNQKTNAVLNIIQGAGYPAVIENINIFHSFLSSIPGHTTANPRKHLISTENLSHFLPIDKTWTGETFNSHLEEIIGSSAPHLTCSSGTNYFYLNLNNGDVGHTLVLGPTGAGKSTLLAILALQWLKYKTSRVIFFDKDYSIRNLTEGIGGMFSEVGTEGGEPLQPLADLDSEEDKASASEFLSLIMEVQELTVTPDILSEINSTIEALSSRPREERTLKVARAIAQNSHLKIGLEAYADGQYSSLFGSETRKTSSSFWETYEMSSLFSYGEKVVQPILFFLFYRVSKSFKGEPTLLILDEAWLYLDNEQFSKKIKDWLKTLRKKNVYVIFSTQEIADAMESMIMPSIISACQSRIFLPNPRAIDPIIGNMYLNFGLSEVDIQIIGSSQPKRDYYLIKNSGKQLIQLDLTSSFFELYKGIKK